LATQARAIVVVADDTENLRWEINSMLSEKFVGKTLFLASPDRIPNGLESNQFFKDILDVDCSNESVVGCFYNNSGWVSILGRKIVMDDYFVSCLAFFCRIFRG